MSQIETRIVDAMSEHGFTRAESKAYVALLKASPATGYELAARSGVPRSAIYNTLKKLAASGAVRAVHDEPKRYAPMAPAQLLRMLESRFTQKLGGLEASFEQLNAQVPDATIWAISGYDTIVARAAALIDAAEHSVHVSLWAREAELLAPRFAAASERGVDVALFSFTSLPEGPFERMSYGIDQGALAEHWDHKLVIVCDKKRALIGSVTGSEDARAVETDEASVIDMTINNLVLDITLFGERTGSDTAAVVQRIANRFAPIEELLPESGTGAPRNRSQASTQNKSTTNTKKRVAKKSAAKKTNSSRKSRRA